MSISRKQIETSIINVGEVPVLVEDMIKTRETMILDFEARTTLTIAEIRSLRDKFVNKKLFQKIIDNAEGSIFLNNILTIEEQIFNDSKALTIKQVAYFAIYYKKQLGQKDSFNRVIKNTEGGFDSWFRIHVKYNFLIKLERFYAETINTLINLNYKTTTVYETDIEFEQKQTIRYIERTFLPYFESFLQYDWDQAVVKNDEFMATTEKKKKTIIFDK